MTTLLAIEWASVGVKTLQFILSFSILVVLHELGHYLPARWFKCRVEKFYLFFNPYFSIYKKKIKDTEWGIGWIPFGGYVKIAGMIDESMDKEQLKLPAEPYEFRAKPAWQRLIIMIGGVIVNILLAIVIFIMITFVWGEEHLPPQNLKFGVYADSLAHNIGFVNGDNVVAIDHKAVEDINAVESEIAMTDAKTITILRDGKSIELNIPADFISQVSKNKFKGLIAPQIPTIVDSVLPSAQITKGELKKGDQIIALNNHPLKFYHEFIALRDAFKDSIVTLTVIRNKDTAELRCLLKDGKVGFAAVPAEKMFGTTTKKYGFFEAIPVGFNRCFQTLDRYIGGLKQIFTGKVKANDSLGSVISIGNTFPGVWDWERFWTLTGIFSIILAFMNILPIPALDGGHALFTIYEMITRHKPSEKFMEIAQTIGMILLLGIMAYALGLDFWRLFK